MIQIKKAQIFSLDLIIAVIIFILILVSIAWAWDYSREKIISSEKKNDMLLVANNVLSVLVETEGNPANWSSFSVDDFNESNILSIGLAKSLATDDTTIKNSARALSYNGVCNLDISKITILDNFDSQKYSTYKKILGINPYDFELSINMWNGANYSTSNIMGLYPDNSENIIHADRFALLNGTWSKISLKVWQ